MVAGHVLLPLSSHRWMLARSYVTPVHKLTGDFITSSDIGHLKKLGIVMYKFSFTISTVWGGQENRGKLFEKSGVGKEGEERTEVGVREEGGKEV